MSKAWLGSCLVLGAAACGSDEVRQAVVAELAVGTWSCAADEPIEGAGPLTIRIDDDGTFGVTFEPAPGELLGPDGAELTGAWAVEDGDLAFDFDLPGAAEPYLVRNFDALDLDSDGFVIENAGAFEDHAGDDPADGEQEFLVEVHDKDSVTLGIPGGTPWTCDRQ